MSMEDILKVLANSRQPGNAPQSQNADPMTELVGSLLGSSQGQSNQQSNGLGNMMGMLEMVMGGGTTNQSMTANDPIMMMLQPYVAKLAKKVNIPNEIAMIVVSYLVHKLLAHHPTSGRDSSSFDLDDMIHQLGSGQLDNKIVQKSGMVNDLSKKTGLDEETTNQAIQAAIELLGQHLVSQTSKK